MLEILIDGNSSKHVVSGLNLKKEMYWQRSYRKM